MRMLSRVLLILILCVPAWSWAAEAADTEAKKPITLDQALEIAFRRSPDVKMALDQLQKSVGGMAEAKANYMPKFNGDVTHFRNGPTFEFPPYTFVPDQATTISGSVYLPLDISSGLGFVSDIARYKYQIDYLNLMGVSEKLIFDVKRAYLDVLRAKGQQDVAQASVDVAAKRLRDSREKFAAGTAPDFDVTRGEVEVANLNQVLIQANARVVIARSSLNRILGIPVSTPTELVNTDIQVQSINVDVPKITEEANQRRPEVKNAETAVLLNIKNTKLQRTATRPSLGISGQASYNTPPYGFTTGHSTWTALVNLSMSIWDGGISKAKVDQAYADVDKSRDAVEQTMLAVALEVQTAAVNLQEAIERVSTTAENVRLAEKSLRLANDRYNSGVTILVEVADAESALTQARFNAVQALYDYAVAVAELERATSTQPEARQLQCLTGGVENGKIVSDNISK
ncbi:MAG: TolC family protein [Armatimonadetes bacterium]|jgi:outer membrane protein TolC|nr:TolC family protein [Armatimonadota bacterium]